MSIANLDLRTIFNFAYPIYGGVFILLIAVEIVGNRGMGAQRWLDLGFVTLQPSEFMRFALDNGAGALLPHTCIAMMFRDRQAWLHR